jgi:hypothetical protein
MWPSVGSSEISGNGPSQTMCTRSTVVPGRPFRRSRCRFELDDEAARPGVTTEKTFCCPRGPAPSTSLHSRRPFQRERQHSSPAGATETLDVDAQHVGELATHRLGGGSEIVEELHGNEMAEYCLVLGSAFVDHYNGGPEPLERRRRPGTFLDDMHETIELDSGRGPWWRAARIQTSSGTRESPDGPENRRHFRPKSSRSSAPGSTSTPSIRRVEDVPLVVELHHGGPVGELFQAGEAATSGAAVATVA